MPLLLGPRNNIYALQWRFWEFLTQNLGTWVRFCEFFWVLSGYVSCLGGTYKAWRFGPLVQTSVFELLDLSYRVQSYKRYADFEIF